MKGMNSIAPKSMQKPLLSSSLRTERRTFWEERILIYWQRFLFLSRNRSIPSVTPSVTNKYLPDPSDATDQQNS